MKIFSRSSAAGQKLAATNVFTLLDNKLILILRTWGAAEHNQKFVDEVVHYLSSTQADLEVTTPFDYQENLSSLANRTRVALLLAHDYFYRSENKNEYLIGFEATVLFKSKNEIAWSSVGRFEIGKIVGTALSYYVCNGTDLDSEVLLPVQLIGIEREIDINSGSLALNPDEKIIVASTFRNQIFVNETSNSIESLIDVRNGSGTCWFSVITSE